MIPRPSHRSRRGLALFCAALSLAVAMGCGGDEPMAPGPGSFDVILQGGQSNVGAVLLLVEGGAVDSVEAIGYYTASAPSSAGATEILVAGTALGSNLVRVKVPDARVQYHAQIQEIAQSTTHQLLPVSDFSLLLLRSSQ